MSLADLAKDLNLSKSTVSRALNFYSDVAPETRERVQKRAEEIGYIANPVAQRLKIGKSNAIGVVLPPPLSNGSFIEPFYSTMLGALVPVLEKSGLQLFVTIQQTTASDDDVNSYQRMVKRGLVDALLILRTRADDSRVSLASKSNSPFVTYGRTNQELSHFWVDIDHKQAIYMAVSRQISRGHRQVAFINTNARYNYAQLRNEGYLCALKAAGIPYYPRWAVESDLTVQDGYTSALKLLHMHPRPTSIVCTSDDVAIGAMTACREIGIEPGKNIAIMGLGNSPASLHTTPTLTSIETFPNLIGQKLGYFLQQCLQEEPTKYLQYQQRVEIVERLSDPTYDEIYLG